VAAALGLLSGHGAGAGASLLYNAESVVEDLHINAWNKSTSGSSSDVERHATSYSALKSDAPATGTVARQQTERAATGQNLCVHQLISSIVAGLYPPPRVGYQSRSGGR